jgi:hypothetical protein
MRRQVAFLALLQYIIPNKSVIMDYSYYSNNLEKHNNVTMYRRIQGLVAEQWFSLVLPKQYGIGKGDFVKVIQVDNKIIIEKA